MMMIEIMMKIEMMVMMMKRMMIEMTETSHLLQISEACLNRLDVICDHHETSFEDVLSTRERLVESGCFLLRL